MSERVIIWNLISLPHATKIMKLLQQKKHSAKAGFVWHFNLKELRKPCGHFRDLSLDMAREQEYSNYKSDEQMYRLEVFRTRLKA